jgi:hypothetical protein
VAQTWEAPEHRKTQPGGTCGDHLFTLIEIDRENIDRDNIKIQRKKKKEKKKKKRAGMSTVLNSGTAWRKNTCHVQTADHGVGNA